MERLCRRLADWRVALLSLLFMLLAVVLFAQFDRARPTGTPGIVALELAFSAQAFGNIALQWGAEAVRAYRTATLLVDYWFPLAYSLFLASLMALLSSQAGKARWSNWVALPFIAALLDWVENTAHLVLLRDPTHLSGTLVLVASMAAALKWSLVAVSVVVILHLIVARMRGRMAAGG
jgi:hypothetical protein